MTIEEIEKLNNDFLFSKFIISYLPDKIDGGYTQQRIKDGNLLEKELRKRLIEIGFLTSWQKKKDMKGYSRWTTGKDY